MRLLRRNSKCFSNSPAETLQSIKQRASGYSGLIAPLRNGQGSASEGYAMIIGSIVLLLFLCSPAAIGWAIANSAIPAFYRVLRRWRMSHVFEECLKASSPALAYGNALRSIFVVGGASRIVAARDHVYPSVIHPCESHSVDGVAFNAHRSLLLFIQTAARLGSTLSQAQASHDVLITASALAEPRRMLVSRSAVATYYRQTAKAFASQIDESRHRVTSNGSIS